MEISQSMKSKLLFLVPFLVAYIGSKIIFNYLSFDYSVLRDKFDITKLLIDIGVFGVLFYIGHKGTNRLLNSSK